MIDVDVDINRALPSFPLSRRFLCCSPMHFLPATLALCPRMMKLFPLAANFSSFCYNRL